MQRRKILITGIVSLTGKYLVNRLKETFDLFGVYHSHKLPQEIQQSIRGFKSFSLESLGDFENYFNEVKPDICIHLAALSNIDYCQTHKKEAYQLNVLTTKKLCLFLKKKTTHLIFASSNAVFSGTNPPYTETDLPDPVNYYGKTKAMAEKLIAELLPSQSSIVRSTSLFGWPLEGTRTNDVPYYLKELKKNQTLHLVNDRIFNPVYVQTLARAIEKIASDKKVGIYNIAGSEQVTRFTFVQKLINIFKIKHRAALNAVSSDFFPTLAPRPKDATLTTNKMQHELGIQPENLDHAFRQMKQEHN